MTGLLSRDSSVGALTRRGGAAGNETDDEELFFPVAVANKVLSIRGDGGAGRSIPSSTYGFVRLIPVLGTGVVTYAKASCVPGPVPTPCRYRRASRSRRGLNPAGPVLAGVEEDELAEVEVEVDAIVEERKSWTGTEGG